VITSFEEARRTIPQRDSAHVAVWKICAFGVAIAVSALAAGYHERRGNSEASAASSEAPVTTDAVAARAESGCVPSRAFSALAKKRF
jgi:hypothetical protein